VTLILVGFAWLLGGLLPLAFGAPWWMAAAWLAAATPVLVLRGPLSGRYGLQAILVAVALFAGWRMDAAGTFSTPQWAGVVGQHATIEGRIERGPDQGETTASFLLGVDSLQSSSQRYGGGHVLVYLNQYSSLREGDRVTVRGQLEAPPVFDDFNYRDYLERRGITATMFRPQVVSLSHSGWSLQRELAGWRSQLDRSLERALPEPAASLAEGIAFGRDDGLSREQQLRYNKSGLRHLTAVSGSNVSLIAAISYVLFTPLLGRKRARFPAAFTILLYVAAAGVSPSVLRAALMAAVLLGGTWIGRPQAGLPAVVAAAMLMTAVAPRIAVDAGFQLSVAATVGIVAFGPWLTYAIERWTRPMAFLSPPNALCEAVALTTAASLATVPIMWTTFGRVSLVAIPANLAVTFIFELAFYGAVLTALVGLVSSTAAQWIAVPEYYVLAYIGGVARLFAGLPFATVHVPVRSLALAAGGAGALAIAAVAAHRFLPAWESEPARTRKNRARTARFAVATATAAGALVLLTSLIPDGEGQDLRVDFLDVGQGDAALVTTPHGHQVLIDGGPSAIQLMRELGTTMKPWDRSLDAVLLSHPQEDHIAGLVEAMRRLSVGRVYESGVENSTETYGYYADERSSAVTVAAGRDFWLDGVHFEVIWPPANYGTDELNDTSVVVRVTYGEVSVLFTGDFEQPAQDQLMADSDVRADVLKVPHHGSKSSDPAFLRAVGAKLAVISVGAGNQFGHPSAEALAALSGVTTVRTDQDGRVTVKSDGHSISVHAER
jgi:competence protein ComEC